jgi:ParB family transcriptional regulator, chromosome partitioning protein
MALMLEGLDLLGTRAQPSEGAPLLLPVDSIDEDPAQPRLEFDQASLRELADSIRERGVRQPISVRPSPAVEGRWLVNFGARRLRASKLAGKAEIPAFIDLSADSYDQVIENEQRQGLTPMELALFIQRRLAAGDIQADIARRMGKSRQYVTMAMALIDAPDWLLAAYRESRCRGLKELYELRKLASEHPQFVQAWTSDRDAITRERVAALRADLSRADGVRTAASSLTQAMDVQPGPRASPATAAAASDRRSAGAPRARRVLYARLDGEIVSIDADHVPSQAGHVFVVRRSAEPSTTSVEASRLTLLGFDAG